MAKIFITNLHANESKFSLISLEERETGLIQTAIERALDARRIGGGLRATGWSERTW
jgi:hypothetical protein